MGTVNESSEELTARWKKEEIPLCESGVVFHFSSIEPDETKAVGLFLKGGEAARVSVDWRGSYVNAEKRSTIDIGIARSIVAKLVSLGALELGDYENMHAMDGVFWHIVVKSAEGVENEFVLLNPDVSPYLEIVDIGKDILGIE